MVKYRCPVEGCNYEADSKQKVHGHLVASGDPAHKDLRRQGGNLWEKIIVVEEVEDMGGRQNIPDVDVEVGNEEVMENREVVEEEKSIVGDEELLELSEKVEQAMFEQKISELQNKLSEIENTLQNVVEQINEINKRLDVHKQSILRILKALGVQ